MNTKVNEKLVEDGKIKLWCKLTNFSGQQLQFSPIGRFPAVTAASQRPLVAAVHPQLSREKFVL